MDDGMPEITREFSFRGRKYWAYAHWSKKGVPNVITFYLNMMGRSLREQDCFQDEETTARLFIQIDFHEWLHLFIRRDSGLKNTFIVSESCEKFIHEAHNVFIDGLVLTYPDGELLEIDSGWFEYMGVMGDG